MDQFDTLVQTIALSMGVAWASGINLYAAILVLGWMGASGNMTLPPDLQVLANPLVMTAAGLMFFIEFFADKVPGVDNGWDAVQTFIRIPAGAVLAAGAFGDVNPALALSAGIVGGGVSAATHATKAGARMLINTSPEPVTNWVASFSEDMAVVFGLWAALNYPWAFLGIFVAFLLLIAWLLPKIWRGIKAVARSLTNLFRRKPRGPSEITPSSVTETA